jgi:hypothetical protein
MEGRSAMNMPGFTADAALYKTLGQYQHEIRLGAHGNNAVVAQSKAEAEQVQKMLNFGQVHCDWIEYCEGRMPNQHCGIKEVCYWWPW